MCTTRLAASMGPRCLLALEAEGAEAECPGCRQGIHVPSEGCDVLRGPRDVSGSLWGSLLLFVSSFSPVVLQYHPPGRALCGWSKVPALPVPGDSCLKGKRGE